MTIYRQPILAAILLVALAPAIAEARGWDIKSVGMGHLVALEGRPVFMAGGDIPQDQVWHISPGGKTTIDFTGGRKFGDLIYPLKGDDPSVSLSTDRKTVKAPKWEVTYIPVKGLAHSAYTIRAAAGKYKGWFLGVELERNKEDEKKGVYRPILVKDPKEPMLFEIYEVAN